MHERDKFEMVLAGAEKGCSLCRRRKMLRIELSSKRIGITKIRFMDAVREDMQVVSEAEEDP